MTELLSKSVSCPKCGYGWNAKLIPNKRYYQCPICKYQFKLEE